MMNNNFLSLNEIDNALDSLNIAKEFIQKDDILKWKWVTIALHHSLYSFCIAALVNCDYENVTYCGKQDDIDKDRWVKRDNLKWKKSSIKKDAKNHFYRIEWSETDELPTEKSQKEYKNKKEKLISFWSAIARVMDGELWMGKTVSSKPLILLDEELEKIYFATEIVRNDLVHFIPKIKVLDISILKSCLLVIIKSIEFLVFDSGTIPIYPNKNISSVKSAINEIKNNLA